MTYWVTSTTGLMERTTARRRRSRIQMGVGAWLLTPRITQPTNVGQAAGASRWTTTDVRDDDVLAPGKPALPRAAAPTAPAAGPLATTPSPSDQASMVLGSVASRASTSLVNS